MSLCRSFANLSVACLVGANVTVADKEELKVNCLCRKLSRFLCQFLSVVGVLEENCRLFSATISLVPSTPWKASLTNLRRHGLEQK